MDRNDSGDPQTTRKSIALSYSNSFLFCTSTLLVTLSGFLGSLKLMDHTQITYTKTEAE